MGVSIRVLPDKATESTFSESFSARSSLSRPRTGPPSPPAPPCCSSSPCCSSPPTRLPHPSKGPHMLPRRQPMGSSHQTRAFPCVPPTLVSPLQSLSEDV